MTAGGWAWPGEAAALAWLSSLGLAAGDRVALGGLNRENTVVVLAAALRAGLTMVPLNRRLTPGELRTLHERARTRLALSDPDHPLASAVPCHLLPPMFSGPAGIGGPLSGSLVLFTSGTTGEPKAVRLHPSALVAAAQAHVAALTLTTVDVWSLPLPLDHVGGIMATLRALLCGCAITLEPTPGPDATGTSIVPTMLVRLVAAGTPPPHCLRTALTGGGPLDAALVASARALGWPVHETYGLTEMGSMVTLDGIAVPGAQIHIDDGRVLVDGPMRCAGYEVAGGLDRLDGWHATGDCGQVINGRLIITGRVAELIISGGENVAAPEVEAVLLRHPAISEACVVGVSDPQWGEQVAAAIVVRASVTPSELDAWLQSRLAGFKRPRRWLVLPSLPRSSLGKVLRDAVRQSFEFRVSGFENPDQLRQP